MVRGRPRQPHQSKYRGQRSSPGHRWLWSLEELESRVLLVAHGLSGRFDREQRLQARGPRVAFPTLWVSPTPTTIPPAARSTFDSSRVQHATVRSPWRVTLVLSEAAGPEIIDATRRQPGHDQRHRLSHGDPVIQVDPGSTATLKALKIAEWRGYRKGGGIDNAGTLTLSAVKLAGRQGARRRRD